MRSDEKSSSAESSDLEAVIPQTPRTTAKPRTSCEIYSLYGVREPSVLAVPSSPEEVLSQSCPLYRPPQADLPPTCIPVSSPTYVPRKTMTPPRQAVTSKSRDLEYTDFVRKADMEYVRTYKDGASQVVKLTQGPNGFAVARLKEGVIETEVPDLALVPIQAVAIKKKPAAASSRKRPAAAMKVGGRFVYMSYNSLTHMVSVLCICPITLSHTWYLYVHFLYRHGSCVPTGCDHKRL